MTGKVWVAVVVGTRDEIVAVAETESEAVRIASTRTLKYLRARDAVTAQTNTVAKVRDWFGIDAVLVPVGGAVFLRG